MLQVVLKVNKANVSTAAKLFVCSREYEMNDSTFVQFRVDNENLYDQSMSSRYQRTLIFIKFQKKDDNQKLSYTIKFTSKQLNIMDKSFVCDDGLWHLVFEAKECKETFDVTVLLDIIPNTQPFLSLYEDEYLTDFELQGEDGSVRVHKVVLFCCSPVFRIMLAKSWKESNEGKVEVAGTSKTTLRRFKSYIYLHTLPEVGVEQLLLLASYYMMPDLEQLCISKLVQGANGESLCVLLEFAFRYKMNKLAIALLDCVHDNAFDINEIRDYLRNSCLSEQCIK